MGATTDFKLCTREEVKAWLQRARERKHNKRGLSFCDMWTVPFCDNAEGFMQIAYGVL